jgi:hypothetical protein
MRLIKHFCEHHPKEEVGKFRTKRRGFYVLYKLSEHGHYDVVYVGIARRASSPG